MALAATKSIGDQSLDAGFVNQVHPPPVCVCICLLRLHVQLRASSSCTHLRSGGWTGMSPPMAGGWDGARQEPLLDIIDRIFGSTPDPETRARLAVPRKFDGECKNPCSCEPLKPRAGRARSRRQKAWRPLQACPSPSNKPPGARHWHSAANRSAGAK